MNDVFFLSCQFNLIQNIFIHIITQKIKKKTHHLCAVFF